MKVCCRYGLCVIYLLTHSLAHSFLSEDLVPDRVFSGIDQIRLTAVQWQAEQSFVCPGQGRGNQSLPTELLI